jgi:serine/threonine protein kinase
MGNVSGAQRDDSTSRELPEHPLLLSVANPVNQLCDHFASSLDASTNGDLLSPESPVAQDVIEFDGFRTLGIVGRGFAGFVYKAIDIDTNQTVALKVYKRIDRLAVDVPREVQICQTLTHPHILPILKTFEIRRPRENLYGAVLPFAEFGSLSHSNLPELTIALSVDLLLQIGDALTYLHGRHIVHRDVKPQNILIFDHGFTLCDFSAAVTLTDPAQLLSDQVGTSVFMAPEVATRSYRPKPTDLWSLGITVFCLLFGKLPFNLAHFFDNGDIPAHARVADNVMAYELEFPAWPVVPDELKAVIGRLLEKDPESRMTAEELLAEEWLLEQREEWAALADLLEGENGS